jgi:DNA-directed RNA polymerase
MALTTIYAKNEGVTNFGGIHDCFATTPAEMSTMREAVRHAFSDIYASNWWEDITDELLKQLPSKVVAALPPRPALGSLNTNQTRSSSYFIT